MGIGRCVLLGYYALRGLGSARVVQGVTVVRILSSVTIDDAARRMT
jgi:hypothetical protein